MDSLSPLSPRPDPPRTLHLPPVGITLLSDFADPGKVISVETIVHPEMCMTKERKDPTRAPPTSPGDYLRGVTTLAAYRAYYFPDRAVQWILYLHWLLGQSAGLSTAQIKDIDVRARTDMAQHPSDQHTASTWSDALRFSMPISAAPTAAPGQWLAPAAGGANLNPNYAATPPSAPPEMCMRFNLGRPHHPCNRPHMCLRCGGAHPAYTHDHPGGHATTSASQRPFLMTHAARR